MGFEEEVEAHRREEGRRSWSRILDGTWQEEGEPGGAPPTGEREIAACRIRDYPSFLSLMISPCPLPLRIFGGHGAYKFVSVM